MSENNKNNSTDGFEPVISDDADINNAFEADSEPVGDDKSSPRRRSRPEGYAERSSGRSSSAASGKDRPAKRRPRPDGSEGYPISRSPQRSVAAAGSARRSSDKRSSSDNGKKKRKRKKFTTAQTILLIGGIIFLLLCIAGLVIYLVVHHYWNMTQHQWTDSVISDRPPVESKVDNPDVSNTFDVEDAEEKLKEHLQENAVDLMSDSDVFNVLLIGQDLRSSSQTARGNTDVMILMSLNKKNKTITMTSFMRDIWLYLPDSGYSNRLNAAYWHGGPDYLMNTLEAYFGVKIDRYVNITFNSFMKTIDLLGGVDVFVRPEEMMGYLPGYAYYPTRGMYDNLDHQNKLLGNPPGTDYISMSYDTEGETLHLNGNQALAYARLRYVGNADFERTERQRKIISKVIEKIKEASLTELNSIANEILGDVTTSITEGETFSLLLNALDYANYDIQQMRIPEDNTFSGHYIGGRSVLLCNTVKNAQDLQMLIYGKTNVDEEQLKKFEQQNKYIDDNGNWIDYYS